MKKLIAVAMIVLLVGGIMIGGYVYLAKSKTPPPITEMDTVMLLALEIGADAGIGGQIFCLAKGPSLEVREVSTTRVDTIRTEKNVQYLDFSIAGKWGQTALCVDNSLLKDNTSTQCTLAHIVQIHNPDNGKNIYLVVK